MSEDDIRKYLSRGGSASSGENKLRPAVRAVPTPRRRTQPAQPEEGYGDFNATHLFCPRCRQAMPVREKLLLFLPDGDLYDYSCSRCGTSVGTRKAGR